MELEKFKLNSGDREAAACVEVISTYKCRVYKKTVESSGQVACNQLKPNFWDMQGIGE